MNTSIYPNTAHLNVGFNWDPELAKAFVNLNETVGKQFNTRIDSVYGSTSYNPLGSARPPQRVPLHDWDRFKECISIFHDAGIKINWTANTNCLGDLTEFERHYDALCDWVEAMAAYIDMYTVAHPLILELLLKSNAVKEIEISTILNVDTLGLLNYYSDWSPKIKRVCLAISRNRDMSFLRRVALYQKIMPKVELLANEFCTVAGHNCQGIYRQSCYECHSHGVGNTHCDNYPMSRCTQSRWDNPESWLKARFILPQWMDDYQALGINDFKISGRTHPSPYIHKIASAYMSRCYQGNLLGLWAQLESIWKGTPGQDDSLKRVEIDVSRIGNFIDHWMSKPDFRCAEQVCGITCQYCETFYKSVKGGRS